MELTVNQVLQKGVDAHKAGQVQEADAPSLHLQALLVVRLILDKH